MDPRHEARMIWWNRLRARVKALGRRKQLDRDLEEELQFHLDMQAQAGAGQREARRQFGNVTSLKEACRERWLLPSVELWLQDARYSARTLRLNPGFAATAVVVLALGIGVNATVFTLANAVMFKNQPFAGSEKILYITGTRPARGGDYQAVSYPDYLDFRAQSKAFESLAAFEVDGASLSDGEGFPEHYRALRISANGFPSIGQKPVIGRDLVPADEAPGAEAVAIVSYRVWDTRYGRSPTVIGKTVRINGAPTAIIGVMGPEMRFPGDIDVWKPLISTPEYAKRDNRFLTLFGKLADGESPSTAQAELSTIAWRLAHAYPQTNQGTGAAIRSFNQFALRDKLRSMFVAMLGAVAFVLLIACANAANLMLGRAVGRAREISIRVALGAGRWRVIRQLLIESVMLAAAAGALGWFIAIGGARMFRRAIENTGPPPWLDFSMDYRVFAYVCAISVASGILFGMAPAMRLSRLDVNDALKDGGRSSGTGRRGSFLSGFLVTVEMALAVVLLAGAGLMIRGFLATAAMPIGVDTRNILTMGIGLPDSRYPGAREQAAFFDRFEKQAAAIPGVRNATVASSAPGMSYMNYAYQLEGTAPVDQRAVPRIGGVVVGDNYFTVLHTGITRGRDFTEADRAGDVPVVIVNQLCAAKLWPGEDPIGKRLRLGHSTREQPLNLAAQPWVTVVGVAPNILQSDTGMEPLIYRHYRQEPQWSMTVMVSAAVSAETLGDSLRRALQSVDAELPASRAGETLDDSIDKSRWPLRVFGTLFTVFAAVALALASIGLYAVMAQTVTRRRHEIGLRLAVGAGRSGILRLVFGKGLRQLAIGLAIGLPAAFLLTQVLMGAMDLPVVDGPAVLAGAAATLLATGILGCIVPALRAVRVDPAITLRHE
jgi:putative ABC transport system permease protein